VNGYTALDLIRDELAYVERIEPEIVSVLIGVNDLVQGRTPQEYRESLTTIYDAVSGRPVVAVSIPVWSYVPAAGNFGGADHVDRLTHLFNEIAHDQAEGRGYVWVDLTEASTSGIGTKGWIADDDLHPGDAQYAVWAEAIWSKWPR
jgi:lysophospholipase L1-like esterase